MGIGSLRPMKGDHKTHNVLRSPDLIHGFGFNKLSCPALWEVIGFFTKSNLFHFTAAFLIYLFFFISLLPKTLCFGEHSFDWRGKTASTLWNKWAYGNIQKMLHMVTSCQSSFGTECIFFFWLILFLKCSWVISCARIFFSPCLAEISVRTRSTTYFFYILPQMHSTVCSSHQTLTQCREIPWVEPYPEWVMKWAYEDSEMPISSTSTPLLPPSDPFCQRHFPS